MAFWVHFHIRWVFFFFFHLAHVVSFYFIHFLLIVIEAPFIEWSSLIELKWDTFFFFFKQEKDFFFLNWVYNIGLISVIHQHELAIGVHTSPHLEPPSHLPAFPSPPAYHRVSGELPASQQIPTGCLRTHASVCASRLLAPLTSPPPPPLPLSQVEF